MAYTPQTWTDSPSTSTPLSAARLTVMENGIQAAATATAAGVETLTNKLIGDKLDFASVTAPAAPSTGTRFYTRSGVSGLDAPAWVNNLGLPMVIGRDIGFFAKNITGATLTKGTVVYVQSATSSVVNIAKAQADSTGTKVPAIGVLAADIANNAFGLVMQYGVIQAVNTAGMGDGSVIYLDPTTAGAFTNTRPAHPAVGQMIGVVVNANTTGIMLVTCYPTNTSMIQGTNNASWGIGDGTTSSARSIQFKNTSTGTLSWTPTTARTLTLPDATDTLVGLATTNTLTNKRLTKRVLPLASSATPAINTDLYDEVIFTLATNVTSMTSGLSGTRNEGDTLWFAITTAASQTIAWGASFIAGPAPLVVTTGAGRTHEIGFKWRALKSAFVCMASDLVGY